MRRPSRESVFFEASVFAAACTLCGLLAKTGSSPAFRGPTAPPPQESFIHWYRQIAHEERRGVVWDPDDWQHSTRLNFAEEFAKMPRDLEWALWHMIWRFDMSRSGIRKRAEVLRSGLERALRGAGQPVLEVSLSGSAARGTTGHAKDGVPRNVLVGGDDFGSDIDLVVRLQENDFETSFRENFSGIHRLVEGYVTGTFEDGVVERSRYGFLGTIGNYTFDVIPVANLSGGGHRLWDSEAQEWLHNNPKQLFAAVETKQRESYLYRPLVILCKLWNRAFKPWASGETSTVASDVDRVLQRAHVPPQHIAACKGRLRRLLSSVVNVPLSPFELVERDGAGARVALSSLHVELLLLNLDISDDTYLSVALGKAMQHIAEHCCKATGVPASWTGRPVHQGVGGGLRELVQARADACSAVVGRAVRELRDLPTALGALVVLFGPDVAAMTEFDWPCEEA